MPEQAEANVIQFAGCEAKDVAAAVQGALIGLRKPWLLEGAEQTQWIVADTDAPVPVAAQRFITVLELAYLVASADGFAKVERDSLSVLLETVTGSPVKQSVLEQHFSELDRGVAAFGRSERLAAASADIEDQAGRDEAIVLTALIAMADGALSRAEMNALSELAGHLQLSADQTDALVHEAAGYIREALL